MNIAPTWTDERITTLKGLWHDGLSCSQIAGEMGTTRNAVIGKLNRLGFNNRTPSAPLRPKPPKPKQIRMYRGPWPAAKSAVEIVPDEPEITDLPADQSDFACTITDLEQGMCRFPLGAPAVDMQYCGAASVGSWCARHHRVVWSKWGRA